jgi:hypothetical protein
MIARVALALACGLAGSGCVTPLGSDGAWNELGSAHFRVLSDVDAAAVARELPRVETALAGIAARLRPDRPPAGAHRRRVAAPF